MLALVCSCLLLAALPADTWSGPAAVELGSDTVEQIRDTHAKVTEIWQALTQQRAAQGEPAGALHAVCRVQPSATLDAAQPRVSGLVVFRQLGPGAQLEAFFDLEGFPVEANLSSRAIHVHQFGDLSQGCDSTGAHYNPPLEVPLGPGRLARRAALDRGPRRGGARRRGRPGPRRQRGQRGERQRGPQAGLLRGGRQRARALGAPGAGARRAQEATARKRVQGRLAGPDARRVPEKSARPGRPLCVEVSPWPRPPQAHSQAQGALRTHRAEGLHGNRMLTSKGTRWGMLSRGDHQPRRVPNCPVGGSRLPASLTGSHVPWAGKTQICFRATVRSPESGILSRNSWGHPPNEIPHMSLLWLLFLPRRHSRFFFFFNLFESQSYREGETGIVYYLG
uniref:Extracellular superoxide dismutase [Cu-Zn] n=1 Tax=Oryctolagus cuniculus TaxID=9986 RepID=A0A5S8H9D4_RABIT